MLELKTVNQKNNEGAIYFKSSTTSAGIRIVTATIGRLGFKRFLGFQFS